MCRLAISSRLCCYASRAQQHVCGCLLCQQHSRSLLLPSPAHPCGVRPPLWRSPTAVASIRQASWRSPTLVALATEMGGRLRETWRIMMPRISMTNSRIVINYTTCVIVSRCFVHWLERVTFVLCVVFVLRFVWGWRRYDDGGEEREWESACVAKWLQKNDFLSIYCPHHTLSAAKR